jgi:RNase H-like domain found in reverse transcriptase
LLAIVWSVTKKFRFYTEYRKIKVYTKHKALIKKTKLTEESKRVVKLWFKQAEFDLTIEDIAGTSMAAADALSQYVAGAAPINDYTNVIMSRHIELGHRS